MRVQIREHQTTYTEDVLILEASIYDQLNEILIAPLRAKGYATQHLNGIVLKDRTLMVELKVERE